MSHAANNRRRQRGVSLIDALIAIAILSFGLIGMSRMQGRMVSSATDAQLRTTATALADELLNTVLVDHGNAACYTLPQTGACSSAAATARTTAWAARVAGTLPGTVTKGVTLNAASGRMTVSIGWTSREIYSNGNGVPGVPDERQIQVVTDVR
ncbi:MAG: pilus assembly protein PilV [Rubrivivax sp.]